jgi:predicted transposase/invertase (TIGR01784 family)
MKKLELSAVYVNPLTDFGFALIFAQDRNRDLLIHFLNAIIGEKEQITDIEYLPVNQFGYLEKDRKAVFDIFCKNEKGEQFIVEMQRAEQKYFKDRSLFYSAFPILKQAAKGEWDFNLKAVYTIAILDFVLFDEEKDDSEYYLEQVYLTRNRTKTLFTDKLNLIFVELPKFTKEKGDLRTSSDFWLYSLKHAEELTFRPSEIQGEIFDKLFETLEINQLTEEEMETYNKSILKYRDVRSAVELAEEKGIKQGIKITAVKLLREGMSIDFVSRTTGIPPEKLIDLI